MTRTMHLQFIALGLRAFLCGSQGLGIFAIDPNRTHATNLLWAGHARFHLFWQAVCERADAMSSFLDELARARIATVHSIKRQSGQGLS